MADQAGPEAAEGRLGEPATDLTELASRLGHAAIAHGVRIAAAESCTGGLVGHAITAIAGSSRYFRGGVVSYADDVKVALLDVPPATLEHHGAVSAQVAVAMAEGVRRRIGSDVAVAVTGVAGPDGGSDAKPVGLTYIAVAGPSGQHVRRFVWEGDRAHNKERSAVAALELLLEVVAADSAGERP
jgi:PncC family amidohydrolase